MNEDSASSEDRGPWPNSSVLPSGGLSLRSRAFWWLLFGLEEPAASARSAGRVGIGQSPDQRAAVDLLSITQSTELVLSVPAFGPLIVRVGPGGASLHLVDKQTGDIRCIGSLDEAHPMSDTFHWDEVQAIAACLEEKRRLPADPSLARLLLTPFAAITEDEDVASIEHDIKVDLHKLGLFSEAEIELAAPVAFVPHRSWAAPEQFARWVGDPHMARTLGGTAKLAGADQPLSHSLRSPTNESFPAELFAGLLTAVGA